MLNSRIALLLAVLALLAGGTAVYLPATEISSQIDRALQQEDDAVASALRARLLADAERSAGVVAALLTARPTDELDAHFGEQMRSALGVSAIVLLSDKGVIRNAYATVDTPAGLGRTNAARAIAREILDAGKPGMLSSFVRAYGQTYVVASIRLAPAPKTADPVHVAAAVVFTRIERGMLDGLSQDHGLVGLDLVEAPRASDSQMSLYDIKGGVSGYLTWEKTSPTQRMLEALMPWIAVVALALMLILSILGILAVRASRRASAATLTAEVLERADKVKSLLFANLSHEFRTPLNAVLGFSEVMKLRTFGPLGHRKYAEYVDDIHASASHLLNLIEDVLTLSRHEAHEGTELNEPVLLAEAVRDAARMLATEAAKKGLVFLVDPFGQTCVRGSEKAIRQVIANLVGNAIKYTENGFVRIAPLETSDPRTASFVVSDSGIGIPAEHLERIMQPFEQIDDVYARRQGGTGLGLSIVSAILRRAGGSMEIESDFGSGTSITVTLRLAEPEQAAAERAAA